MIYRSLKRLLRWKQGVGRLIRDVTDRGAVIICDNRLVMRNYGETFLKVYLIQPVPEISTKWYNSYKMRKWINNENITLLALDTSTEACSVALWHKGEKHI